MRESHHPSAKAARRARAGNGVYAHFDVAFNDLSKVPQGGVQLLHHIGSRALLRAVHRRGALRAGERIGHVARHGEPGLTRPFVQPGHIYSAESGQGRASRRKVFFGLIQQARAKGLGHPRPAVVRRASAQAHDEAAEPGVECLADQLAQPVGGRAQRVQLVEGEERKAGGARRFDNGRPPVAQRAPLRRDGLADGRSPSRSGCRRPTLPPGSPVFRLRRPPPAQERSRRPANPKRALRHCPGGVQR